MCVVCLTAEMSGFLLLSVLPFKAKTENIVISLKHIARFKENF